MNAIAKRLRQFDRRVMWRLRLLAAQDWAALCGLTIIALSGAVVLLSKLDGSTALTGLFSRIPLWVMLVATAVSLTAAIIHFIRPHSCFFTAHVSEAQAAHFIDQTLDLKDRFATALPAISRDDRLRPFEHLLVDDLNSRLEGARPSSVARYRIPQPAAAARCWTGAALTGVVAITVAIVLSRNLQPAVKAAPAPPELVEAGQQIEQSAEDVGKQIDGETQVAQLAKEQAEVGKMLPQIREAEALRRLNSLAERIRARHEQLRSTRADEVVGLAEKRLGSEVTPSSRPRRGPEVSSVAEPVQNPKGELPAERSSSAASDESAEKRKPDGSQQSTPESSQENKPIAKARAESAARTDPGRATDTSKGPGGQKGQGDQTDLAKSPGNEKGNKKSNEKADMEGSAKSDPTALERGSPNPTQRTENGAASGSERVELNDRTPRSEPETGSEPGNKESGFVLPIEQAAKLVPKLSEQLLEKAADLRADQIKPEDIARIKQAAEALLGDLEKMQNSEELRQALEQLARKVDPAQLEQVARQLMSQEKLRDELRAAARLLSENREAREMIAGLARRAGEIGRRMAPRTGERGGEKGEGQQAGEVRRSVEVKQGDPRRLPSNSTAKEPKPRTTTAGTPKDEFVYARPKAGEGVARVPYSAAYPSYRRQAERAVQRGQVPPHLRSLVKTYFDSINPDASGPKRP